MGAFVTTFDNFYHNMSEEGLLSSTKNQTLEKDIKNVNNKISRMWVTADGCYILIYKGDRQWQLMAI